MLQSWRAVFTRFRALLRSDAAGVRAGFYALLLSSGGDLIAGLTLGSITGTLEALPGLLVLVPAAIGMRGNVFGALGSRLGTAVHTGTFRMSARRDTLVGQNLAASLSMSLSVSLVLAILAKAISVAFGLENTISVADFVVISVIGGFLSSIVVMGITVVVARARRPPQLGPRQRHRADRHRRGRHGHAAGAVPRHLPRRHPVVDGDRRRALRDRRVDRAGRQPPLPAADPAAHRARVAAGAGPRRHDRRHRRAHHREALRVVPRVPRAPRARATVPRGLGRARQHPERARVDQAAPRHARARARAACARSARTSSSSTCTRSRCSSSSACPPTSPRSSPGSRARGASR